MKRWSLILFAAGVLSGLIFISLATWADQEASLFELTSAYDKNLSSLRCPLMIARDEESSISVTVKNPSTYTVNPLTTAHITSGYILLINEFQENPSLSSRGRSLLLLADRTCGCGLQHARTRSRFRGAVLPAALADEFLRGVGAALRGDPG